ncbi:peptide/nickel transport system permease protein [Desulfotomaculum arcticum]|uniref:Peptide/nickel transport system permease protein n=1 Tax=Desulfotruncus arcticus DSM 17038 TaxID=1121424 RepID=A0A1I2T0M4_9FIRM|nr:nickel ABC transporter permease subunit NikC [Desulfotruncus arcticus]SFG57689.1 peptide/nickel transport system permease protein [Desulfotomaculum arcticum] [Desulfotruncus arcticus DSM 17038]
MLKRFCREKTALAGLVIVVIFVAAGLLAPWIAPADPTAVNVEHKLLSPSPDFPLGTDQLGRCIFSRLIYGARTSLFYALLVMAIILAISIPVGTLAGYAGGKLDNFIMRVIDILLAFPSLILSLAIAGLMGPGMTHLLIALAAVWWIGYARIIRGMVLQIKEKDFVLAAKACGASRFQVVFRHILLNALSPIMVLATLEIGSIILAISGLSFLGLGAQPPTPEWGAMLSDSRPYIQAAPSLMLFPGLTIMIVVMAFNFVGEGLKNAVHFQKTGGEYK